MLRRVRRPTLEGQTVMHRGNLFDRRSASWLARTRFADAMAAAFVAGSTALMPASTGAAEGLVGKLARGGQVACEPALPHFCANVHVSCAGRSTLETFAFTIRAGRTQGMLEAEAASEVAQHFADARVHWEAGSAYVILEPRHGPGYVKLLDEGGFVLRYYRREAGLMAYGSCR